MDFCVIKEIDGKTLTARINGALNTSTSPVFFKELEPELENIDRLILDFKDMPHTTSAGLRVLLLLMQKMENRGTMKLINVNDDVLELLDNIGFLSMLTVE